MNKFIKEYFNYSKGEIRGLLVLIILIIGVFILPKILNGFKKDNTLDISDFEMQLSRFEAEVKPAPELTQKIAISYFVFDPNTISQNNLVKLGLSKKQARTLINYRKAGGVFVNKKDLKKIYTIDEKLYKKLEPFIAIKKPEKNNEIQKHTVAELSDSIGIKKYKTKNIPLRIELNTADSVDLIKLYGIGTVLARRIINYRNFLGGYYSKNQLLEVFGITEETFLGISKFVLIDTAYINKLDINIVEFKTLNKHPYITYSNTKSILKYRKLMGRFSSVEALLENHLVDSITFFKVKPYIKIE